MTILQQAQNLLTQFSDEELVQVVKLMNELLDKQTLPPQNRVCRSAKESEELFQKLMALREETLKYSFEDVETAKKNAIAEKYSIVP